METLPTHTRAEVFGLEHEGQRISIVEHLLNKRGHVPTVGRVHGRNKGGLTHGRDGGVARALVASGNSPRPTRAGSKPRGAAVPNLGGA